MKTHLKLTCFTCLALSQVFIARAEYKEAMDPKGQTVNLVKSDNSKNVNGPSIAAVYDATQGSYKVKVTNVTSDGFKYNKKGVITDAAFGGREKDKWNIVNKIPGIAKPAEESAKPGKKNKKK